MNDSSSTPSTGTDAVGGSHLTVEDAGTTTDPADLVPEDRAAGTGTGGTGEAGHDEHHVTVAHAVASTGDRVAPDAPSAPGAPEPPQAPTGGRSALAGDDDDIGHVFDQTNGVVDGLDGDSDGTADSDERSAQERADENPAFEAFADTEAPSTADTGDTRVTGS